MKEFLNLQENKITIKYFLVFMLVAYLFSIAVRMIWVSQFSGEPGFMWNNQLMINTNDGYYYAEGARDILSGATNINSTSPVNTLLSKVTAMLATFLPISFETLILYMPTFIGSLLVVPIMLISRLFNIDKVGVVAALLGAITWSYYNRTMTGYYDTDMLTVVLPSMFIWGVLFALIKKKSYYFLIAPIFALIAMNWHNGMIHIVNGTFFLTLFYTVIAQRHNRHYYQFLAVLVIALTTLSIIIKLLLMFIMVGLFYLLKDKVTDKIVIIVTILSALVYLYFGGIDWINQILHQSYVTRALHAGELDFKLHYYGVINTIRETGHIPFEVFANRISGHTITFVLSMLGYILLLIRYRLLILTLPMVVLGMFALQGGLRFTVFAVPFMAMGISFLIFLTSQIFQKLFQDSIRLYARAGFISLSTILILYPNITHIIGYRVPTVCNKDEVKVLSTLGSLASREDYVISWWDYGFPIRYYSDVKTLIDGAQHTGGANYAVSFALLNNQVAAANMARLSVEFNELNFKNRCGTTVECILKSANFKNPNELLARLSKKGQKLIQKSRDVYFYLPSRMLNIIPTIDLFSNLDLLTSNQKEQSLFYQTTSFSENSKEIDLGRGIKVLKNDGRVKIGNKVISLNKFIVTEYDKKGVLHKKIQTIDKSSNLIIIYMKSYNKFLLLDKRLFNSLYIQLFVLENFDKDLYEPVIGNPFAKVYKLKI